MRDLERPLVVLVPFSLTRVKYDIIVEQDVEIDDSRAVAESLFPSERLLDRFEQVEKGKGLMSRLDLVIV